MARDGDLTGTGPVVYSGDVSDAALPGVLAHTDRVIVSDTNRRDVVTVNGFNLDAGSNLWPPARTRTARPATCSPSPAARTVAWFPDARPDHRDRRRREGLRGAGPRPSAQQGRRSGRQLVQLLADVRELEPGRDSTLRVDFTPPDHHPRRRPHHRGGAGGRRADHLGATRVLRPQPGRRALRRPVQPGELRAPHRALGRDQDRRGERRDPATPVGFAEISFTGVDLHEWISPSRRPGPPVRGREPQGRGGTGQAAAQLPSLQRAQPERPAGGGTGPASPLRRAVHPQPSPMTADVAHRRTPPTRWHRPAPLSAGCVGTHTA